MISRAKAQSRGSVQNNDSRSRVVHERKSSTAYLELLDRSAFDVVINPAGLECISASSLSTDYTDSINALVAGRTNLNGAIVLLLF